MKAKRTTQNKIKPEAPKLPRFKAPKSMNSVIFKTKKEKASTRQKLNLKAKDPEEDNV